MQNYSKFLDLVPGYEHSQSPQVLVYALQMASVYFSPVIL